MWPALAAVTRRREPVVRGAIDPYLRVLAAVALVFVVSGAVLDLAWLPLLFPAVGVLFAVGGAVAASAADRAASGRAFVRPRADRRCCRPSGCSRPPCWRPC